jgi:glycosyltransferase involved in cell wall biosynthesis
LPDSARPAALLLAPESPYPPAGGGALRTASLLHYLAARYDTDVIVFRQPGDPDPARLFPSGLARRVSTVDLRVHGRGLASRAARNAARVARRVPPLVDRFSGYAEEIAGAIGRETYEVGIVEHFWCAPYWTAVAPACVRAILDLHNVESVLHARCAADRGPQALAHRVFEPACRELERQWLPRFDTVLTASEEDARAVHAIAPGTRVRVYPNALPAAAPPLALDEEAIVFSGNMEYHPNRAAVRFFRQQVWPLLRDRWPGLAWRLVGKNPESVRRFTEGDPRIQVTGAVEDAVAELARSRVAVVPLLAGSGTRLKILEAWAAGLPVVSTSIGAEGLGAHPGEHLLIADTPAEFAEAVSRLLACIQLRSKLAAGGRLLLQKEFTWEKAWARLDF